MKLEIKAIPPSLNKVLRMHRWAKKDLKDEWILLVREQLNADRLKCSSTQRMKVKVTIHHSRLYDRDNAWGACKVLFDALRHWLLIHDDSPEWLEATILQQKCPHRQRKTIVELKAA